MDFLPQLKLEFDNQWILLIVYAAVFLISVLVMAPERRRWLFEDSIGRIRGWKKAVLRSGQLITFGFLILVCFTPLSFTLGIAGIIGSVLYVCGLVLVPLALHTFNRVPMDQPALSGPYRFSRNPQWVGLYLVFLGLAINTGSVLMLGLVLITGLTYHVQIVEEEKMCLERFGASYQAYLQRVPRYLIF